MQHGPAAYLSTACKPIRSVEGPKDGPSFVKATSNTPKMATRNTPREKTEPKAPPAKTKVVGPAKEHTYDPVGMAGKKAGKVEEIEEQLRREGEEPEQRDRSPKKK